MELGQFPLSLHIKNIIKLQTFYENFGFKACPECGSIADKYLALHKSATLMGLFEGMFESNILTFNPNGRHRPNFALASFALHFSSACATNVFAPSVDSA